MPGDVINLNPNISILDSTVLNDVVTEIVDSIGAVAETHDIELNDEFAQDMAIAMRFVRAGFARPRNGCNPGRNDKISRIYAKII